MNLWVIRSARENPGTVGRLHPSREMGRKELPSTPHIKAFPLVSDQLPTLTGCWSPGRYPGSAQAHRVSPTGQNLLSTAPVDNRLFRRVPAAYGFRVDCLDITRMYVSVQVTTLPNTYSIGAEVGVRGARGRPADL